MNTDFNQLTDAVMDHITAQNRSEETKKTYQRCFCSLTTYLEEKGVVYSQEEATLWLSSVENQVNQTDFSLFKAAVNKLNDIYLYGVIHKGHYDYSKTIEGKLCPGFKRIHSQLLDHISGLADDTISSHSWQCASIFLRFQNYGIYSITEITYDILIDEFNYSAKKTYYAKSMHHSNLRLLLQFLYERGLVPYGFTLFVDAMTIQSGSFWNRMPEEKICELRSSQDASGSDLHVFLEMRDALYLEHCKENYSNTALRGITRITNLFYLFMDPEFPEPLH